MVKFSIVVIPLQVIVALVAALVLDEVTGRLARFARLVIFLPYAIPVVLGALMWGFLYSPSFGPIEQISALFNVQAPFLLSEGNIFYGLLNVVTWQWAGYYMIIIYAALQGIDTSIYEAARIDGANSRQIALRVKIPLVSPALALILVFALIGTLQFFVEPQILGPIANGTVTPDFTPNIYAFNLAFRYAQFNYASAISFSLGFVVFVAVAIFMFVTRKRGSFLYHCTSTPRRPPRRRHRRKRHVAAPAGPGSRAVYFLVPVWWLVVASTKNAEGLFAGSGALWFNGFHLFDNLHDLFTFNNGEYLRWLGNSVLYAFAGGVGCTIAGGAGRLRLREVQLPRAATWSSPPCSPRSWCRSPRWSSRPSC